MHEGPCAFRSKGGTGVWAAIHAGRLRHHGLLAFIGRGNTIAAMDYELGVIGAGNMAEAIVRGVLRGGVFEARRVIAADPAPQRRALFERELGARVTDDNAEAARSAGTILLSVKPQHMAGVLAALGQALRPQTLVISIAAGVSSAKIAEGLNPAVPWRIVRTMPNTPMLVGEGMVAIARGAHATDADLAHTRRIFESAASVVEVDEEKINAVTAVSGSGPAYFFYLVEQMVRAGVELGLAPEKALLMASKTALGAARMLMTSGDSPQELRRKVTSPGGTTQAAIETMQARGVDEAIVAALKRACERGRELGG